MVIERQTILIVDDTVENIEVLSGLLSEDYEILFAANGADALKITEEHLPDLILLDVIMDGMDGYEVCRQLKANTATKSIPVIFVTAMDAETDEEKGLNLGAIDYITKPVSPPIVKARIRNHLELKRYRDILQRMSLIDGLTGIPNRRHFNELLEREWRRAVRSAEPFSLILIDIDFFKLFNDKYGHLAGDDCLKKVGSAIAASVKRPGDLVARYGGEEFACVLSSTGAAGASALAEEMRKEVIELRIPHGLSKASEYVTLSLGVATLIPIPGLKPDMLIKEADNMLYKAKENGRNRVEHIEV